MVDVALNNLECLPPKIGDIVTFSYQRAGVISKTPVISRIRPDMTWEELLVSSFQDKKFLSGNFGKKRFSAFLTSLLLFQMSNSCAILSWATITFA